jgi:hypothetical protein
VVCARRRCGRAGRAGAGRLGGAGRAGRRAPVGSAGMSCISAHPAPAPNAVRACARDGCFSAQRPWRSRRMRAYAGRAMPRHGAGARLTQRADGSLVSVRTCASRPPNL